MQADWQSIQTLPPLEPGELQVWHIRLGDLPGDPHLYSHLLSAAEQERATRLRAGNVRMQFVVARSCLRTLLGNLLDIPPSLVPITLSPYGKPQLALDSDLTLFFNLAHSRETILIALSRTPVGIDVEYHDRDVEALEIARTSFTTREIVALEQAADPEERQRLFFRCWTRKEAVMKADGRGLSLPLTSFEVPVLASANSIAVGVSNCVESPEVGSTWFVSGLALSSEIAAAFATAVPNLTTRRFSFPIDLLAAPAPAPTLRRAPTFEG